MRASSGSTISNVWLYPASMACWATWKRALVAGGFDGEDKADVRLLKFRDKRGVGIERIGHRDQGQMGM